MKLFCIAAMAATVLAGGHEPPQPEQWQIDQWANEAFNELTNYEMNLYSNYGKKVAAGFTPNSQETDAYNRVQASIAQKQAVW